MEQFSKEYSKISHLSKDYETWNKLTKPKLVGSLMVALTVLQFTFVKLEEMNRPTPYLVWCGYKSASALCCSSPHVIFRTERYVLQRALIASVAAFD